MAERPYSIAAGVIAFGLVWLYQASLCRNSLNTPNWVRA